MIAGVIAAPAMAVLLVVAMMMVRWLDGRFGLHPEVRRKLMHVGMGLVCAGFPWVFDAAGWVAVACGLSLAVLAWVRRGGGAAGTLGSSLFGVARRSLGDVCFAFAVVILFALAEDPVFYVVPVLVLTLGDAAAALIGIAYGRKTFATRDGLKSWEGSATMFAVAFAAVHVPLLLGTGIGRAETLLIAVILAVLATLLEGMAWHGLDNLTIPLGTYLMLVALADESTGILLGAGVVLLMLTAAAVALGRAVGVRTDGLFAAVAAGFLIWAVGGWRWLLLPAMVFLYHPYITPFRRRDDAGADAAAVLTVASTAAAWLVIGQMGFGLHAYYPFAVGCGAHLAMIAAWYELSGGPGPAGRVVRLLRHGMLAWAAIVVCSLVAHGVSTLTLQLSVIALPAPVAAAFIYAGIFRNGATGRLVGQAGVAFAASLVSVVPLLLLVPLP